MNGDWIFRTEEYTCGLRAAGVIVRDGKIFVQRERDGCEYAVPGGHVRLGEPSAESLVREFAEETGCRVEAKRILWTEECFWEWKGRKAHDICFYYLAEFLPGEDIAEGFIPQRDNPNVMMGWLDISALADVIIYPEFIKGEIHDLNAPSKHFVTRA